MIQKVDVLICGSGSAGLCAAAWLARYGIRCKILEKSAGPMEMGKADGVQCRTVEVFQSFGIAEELLRESYHVLEVAFWSSDGNGGIHRTSRTADTAPGLSHQPHVILNQARVNGLLIEAMRRWNGQEIDYNYNVKSVESAGIEKTEPTAYPVRVVAEKDGKDEVFETKYALGCDGAHSSVRRSLGYKMVGDSTDSVWGVMDIYPQTNFPDIRKKATVHSDNGNILVIPREGGSLVRFYIQLPPGTIAKDVKLQDLHDTARAIFKPYDMEFAETFWWSAYSIGQRLADKFSKDNRIFLTGDACHTHSPKAGQGMNTSLQDGYNIGWKLASILSGQAGPELLSTYNIEREKVAADLIDFDRYFTKLFSSKASSNDGHTAEHFSEQFVKSGRYTAGLTAKYTDSSITSAAQSTQALAKNLIVGMRFPSVQVVRFCDARAVELVNALPADGRWRIVIFAGDIRDYQAAGRLEKLSNYLDSEDGPVHVHTPSTQDIDSFIEPIVVVSGKRVEIEQEQIPSYFWPVTGKWRMRDLHKLYVDDESYNSGHGNAYQTYQVDPKQGAVVIVRPDQCETPQALLAVDIESFADISKVVALEDHKGIGEFFEGFALSRK